MIGEWTRCVGGEALPSEGELVIFVRSATHGGGSTPAQPFEDLLGERAEIVPALFVAGSFIQQNGHSQPPSSDLWWTSLPEPPEQVRAKVHRE